MPSTSSAILSSHVEVLQANSSSQESDDEDDEPLSNIKARKNPPKNSQAKKKRTTLWKKHLPNFSCPEFSPPQSSSIESQSCKDPLDYFKLFFHKDLVRHIVEQTNLYAGQKNKPMAVTEDEIYVILGAMLLSGYAKLPNKRLYFSKSNDVPKILVESIRCKVGKDYHVIGH